MDGTTANDHLSMLIAHQEEFGGDNRPQIEEQWTMEDADNVIESFANSETVSSSYHDINESVLRKGKYVSIKIRGQRKSPRRRYPVQEG